MVPSESPTDDLSVNVRRRAHTWDFPKGTSVSSDSDWIGLGWGSNPPGKRCCGRSCFYNIVRPTGSSAMVYLLGSPDACLDSQKVEEVAACNFWGWARREWQLCFYCLECLLLESSCHAMRPKIAKGRGRRSLLPSHAHQGAKSVGEAILDVLPLVADYNNLMRCPAEPCLNSWVTSNILWANILMVVVLSH